MIIFPVLLISESEIYRQKTHRRTYGAFLYILRFSAHNSHERGVIVPNRNPFRVYCLMALLLIGLFGVMIQIVRVSSHPKAIQAGARQGKYHMQVQISAGAVYDRYFRPVNQGEKQIVALVNPTAKAASELLTAAKDPSVLSEHLTFGTPFLCELKQYPHETDDLLIFEGRTKRSGAIPAQHIIGYRQNGKGVAGLEKSYHELLSASDYTADITMTVDAHGAMLAGGETKAVYTGQQNGGIVTTLDLDIQKITDTALQRALPKAGAAIVMDCANGDILAVSSSPVYDPDHLADALGAPNAPFLNRALCAYNVGSVFKLAIASAALENGGSVGYQYDCCGSIDIHGQMFRCHRTEGHGLLDLQSALTKSCNPYYISLTRTVPAETLLHTAELLGFGQPIALAPGISADAGVLQTLSALHIPAEKANFSFGQGKLLATPLHIAAMTACIANHGVYSVPRLIIGETADGITLTHETGELSHRAMTEKTADTVRGLMAGVLTEAADSKGIPSNNSAGGKTSTAQTGQFGADGEELCHAWMTGFFPAEHPQYAVTVLIENGGSGNDAAAPVFRKIIEEITRLRS